MMDNKQGAGATTEVSRVIHAPRSAVYQAFLNQDALARWLPPGNMMGYVHTLEPQAGGKIHMSLVYQDIDESPDDKGGKSTADADTFEGEIVELVADEKIVWATEFESDNPDFAGTMIITWSLRDADEGTHVTARCENIPAGVRPEDNEAGSRSSLEKLAAYLE